MSFNQHNLAKNANQLFGKQAQKGYDWWWHSFTAHHATTGEERAFFIEFFLCNPEAKHDLYTLAHPVHLINHAQLNKGRAAAYRPSYAMVKAGTWGKDATQLHRFFPWQKTTADKGTMKVSSTADKGGTSVGVGTTADKGAACARVSMGVPFSVVADDCQLTETESHGHIRISDFDVAQHPEWMCGAGEMEWHLTIRKDIAFNVGYGTSKWMRHWQAFEMFWHAEGMRTFYEGEVIFNGEKYLVTPETCYGYADKNWGKDFTTPLVWLSSCNLTSELTGKRLNNSVFDIGGGRPKIGFLSLPGQLLSAVYYEGEAYEFNFSKFWTFCRTKFSCKETEDAIVWHVEQRSWSGKMIADITCQKSDMLLVNYEAPNGLKRHNRLWNGGNGVGTIQLFKHGKLIDRMHAENVGCEYGEYCEPPIEKSWFEKANEKTTQRK